MDDLEKELKEDFLQEAQQLCEDIEQAFLELEHRKDDIDLLNEIFRFAHNLKGTSRAVGFGEMAEFTHELENLILKLKEKIIPVTDEIVTILLESNDHVGVMVKMLTADMNASMDSSELIQKIVNVIEAGGQTSSVAEATQEVEEEIQLESQPEASPEDLMAAADAFENKSTEELEALLDQAAIDAAQKGEMTFKVGETEIGQPVEESKPTPQESTIASEPDAEPVSEPEPVSVPEPVSEPAHKESKAQKRNNIQATASKKDESIRVSLGKVEALNNFVGELVILQTVLNQRGAEIITDDLLQKSLNQLGKLSKEIQDISMSLRMVPLKPTMAKMSRIVRDTSKDLGKLVNLRIEGEDTEIDKTVLEHLADPLVHIVRNAVDHGLETTEERIDKGKSQEGNILIHAYHEGNNLIIDVKDDGGGIDPQVIKRKAIEKGLLTNETKKTDDELINLIFHPGFSTKEQVTEVSGRGVGMDVVKTNIEKLSGDIRITSKKDEGSNFRIQLPLTLAIIEAMVIEASDEKYVIPFAQVSEFLRISKKDVHFVSGIGDCLDLRGEILPLLYVEGPLNRKISNDSLNGKTAIIVKNEKSNYAIVVDDIINQQQVVIKKIGLEIRNQTGFMGSAILGDGKPSIILDLIELFADHKKLDTKVSRMAERTV